MDFTGNLPIFLQIQDWVRKRILEEKWKDGDRLPSVRELAVDLEVNPNTVVKAFADLQRSGILENRRGVGYFVAPEAGASLAQAQKREFLAEVLPGVIQKMRLLGLDLEDFAKLWKEEKP
jgi:GntR family transcriptional regulator